MENITVIGRVRPTEGGTKRKWKQNVEENNFTTENGQTIQFDYLYDETRLTREIMDDIKPKVDRVIEGYNLCIAAYGHSGSGKTHTMCGSQEEPGLMQHIVDYVIQKLKGQTQRTCLMTAMLFEVYNEHVYDLLTETDENEFKLQEGNQGLSLTGATTRQISSVEDLESVLKIGMEKRRTGSTNFNERSSRSHVVLCISIEGAKSDGDTFLSNIQLVDLAGSEGADAYTNQTRSTLDARREGRNINRSLSTFVRVVKALGEKHVPYRESKLTRLLQQSLTNAQVALICTVDLNDDTATTSTLNFAKSAKCIKVEPKKTKLEGAGAIQRLQTLLLEKEQELAALKSQKASEASQEEHKQKIAEIRKFFLIGSSNEKPIRKMDRRASWGGMLQPLDKRPNFFDEPFLNKRAKMALNAFDENSEENIDDETPEKIETPLILTSVQNDVGTQCKLEGDEVSLRESLVAEIREKVESKWQADREALNQAHLDVKRLKEQIAQLLAEQSASIVTTEPSESAQLIDQLQKDLILEKEKTAERDNAINNLNAEKASLLYRLEFMQSKLANKEDFEEQLKGRLQESRNENSKLLQHYEKLKAEMKEVENRLNLCLEEIAGKDQETKQLKQKINDLASEVSEARISAENALREKNLSVRDLQEAHIKHQTEMNAQLEKYAQLQAKINEEANKENQKWVINKKEYVTVEQLVSRIVSLETQRTTGYDHYDNLQEKYKQVCKQLEEKDAVCKQLEEKAAQATDENSKKWVINNKEYSNSDQLAERILELENLRKHGVEKYRNLEQQYRQVCDRIGQMPANNEPLNNI